MRDIEMWFYDLSELRRLGGRNGMRMRNAACINNYS